MVAPSSMKVALEFRDNRIAMLVGRRTTTKQAQDFRTGVPKFVLLAGWNGDCVARFYFTSFTLNTDPACALSNVINLFGFGMKMFLSAAANRQARFSHFWTELLKALPPSPQPPPGVLP